MKLAKLLIVVVSVLLFAVAANAGTLTYSPDSFSLTVEAGASQTVAFQTTLTDSRVTSCYLLYSLRGNLPASWVALPPASTLYTARSTTLPSRLTVTVPGQAAPGTYAGYLIPSVRTSPAETITVGSGIQISVTVPGGCDAPPEFTNISYPAESWTPSDKAVNVAISGTCTVPEGCTVTETKYTVEDEYGVYSGEQGFSLAPDGSFSVSVPIEASRKGDDKDGRLYTITFSATNEKGTANSPVYIRIAHDQGKK